MLTRYEQRNLTWVDLVAPNATEVGSLMHEFGFDPLIADELVSPSFKSKIERRGDIIYVILHFPALRGLGNRGQQEMDFIIGRNFLITTRYENIDPLHTFARAFEVNSVLGRASASHGGHLFIDMVKNLYQALGNECELMHEKLREIEDKIFSGHEKGMVVQLSHVGRVIHDFREALIPHQEMLTSLDPAASRLFGQEFSYYVRDLVGVYNRIEQTLEHLRNSLLEMRETNNSLLSLKQNEIMKTLTVLTFIFLPITFIANLFAMDTLNNPIVGHPFDFWIIVGGMMLIAICCFLYFKGKKWL